MTRTRALALGGVAGPVAFVSSWVALGAATSGYSPVTDAISRLAATGAPSRPWMTAGMVTFGMGVGAHSLALRDARSGRAWIPLGFGAAATLAVAAIPLGGGSDSAHGVAAAAAYAGLAVSALVAGREWSGRWSRWSTAAGVVSGVLLVASAVGPWTGLAQRAGLTAVDAWIVATAVDVLRRSG